MRSTQVRAAAVALLATQALTACYVHRPLTTAEPAPDTQVLVRLTDQGSTELTGRLGPQVTVVNGVLGAVRGDTLDVRVRGTETRSGGYTSWQGELVSIPRSAAASVEERRLDRPRSFLLAGIFVAGVVAIGQIFGIAHIFEGGDDDGQPVPPF